MSTFLKKTFHSLGGGNCECGKRECDGFSDGE